MKGMDPVPVPRFLGLYAYLNSCRGPRMPGPLRNLDVVEDT